jgi:PIN domain nuclease of toxin-antitoxin system
VTETAAAVTDTHPLLFHAAGGGRLGRKAAAHFAACERRQAILYVPTAVIWECALLARAGRVNLRRSVRGFFDDLFSNPAYQPYDLTAEQVFTGEEIRVNRDPFDALICAAARDLELPLITRDGDIRSSGLLRVVW